MGRVRSWKAWAVSGSRDRLNRSSRRNAKSAHENNKNYTIFDIPVKMAVSEDRSMNISLTAHFEKFVKEVLSSGRFKSASEVVREGLRLLEEREARLAALRREIAAGPDSGEPVAYDAEAIKRQGREALRERQGRQRQKV